MPRRNLAGAGTSFGRRSSVFGLPSDLQFLPRRTHQQETQQAEHPEDWLLSMEIFEILDATDQQRELKTKIEKFLNEKKAKTKDLSTLISWGFRLVDYHKKPDSEAALQASPK